MQAPEGLDAGESPAGKVIGGRIEGTGRFKTAAAILTRHGQADAAAAGPNQRRLIGEFKRIAHSASDPANPAPSWIQTGVRFESDWSGVQNSRWRHCKAANAK
jgi:hypothetical protein